MAVLPGLEPVKELPNPLIPADAGIQTLPNCTDFQRAKAGSPRPRGRADGDTPLLRQFPSQALSRGRAGVPFGDFLTGSFARHAATLPPSAAERPRAPRSPRPPLGYCDLPSCPPPTP